MMESKLSHTTTTHVSEAFNKQASLPSPMGPVRTSYPWTQWTDEALLATRFCDLKLRLHQTPIRRYIDRIHSELEHRNLKFRPHFWLAEEWFSPDGVPGVAIPFYLAHPRLARLEQGQMLEVEGGAKESCLKILRHEVGHAIENAYRLRRRKKRREIFGSSGERYPAFYSPRPYSKRYVLHLDHWYAQSHPDEDFAETFAIWLDPNSMWQKRYRGWPALRKLEYMDALMKEIAGHAPPIQTRAQIDPLYRIKKTLGAHYREKRNRFGVEYPNFYDRDLRKLFSDDASHKDNMAAAACLRKMRREIRKKVSLWTGEYQYTIDNVIEDMIQRSKELNLKVCKDFKQTKTDFTILLTVQTMNYLHSGRHRVAL